MIAPRRARRRTGTTTRSPPASATGMPPCRATGPAASIPTRIRSRARSAGRYDLALYPEGPAGLHIYSGSHTFAIPTTVTDRPAALALLRFLTSRESQALEARLGTLPARTDALQDARSEAPDGSLAQRRWDLLEQAVDAALLPPRHPHYAAVEDAIWSGVREALVGSVSVDEALRRTQEQATRAAHGEDIG